MSLIREENPADRSLQVFGGYFYCSCFFMLVVAVVLILASIILGSCLSQRNILFVVSADASRLPHGGSPRCGTWCIRGAVRGA